MKKQILLLGILLASLFTTNQTQAQDPFIGEIRMFGGNFAPRGWAFCDGQLLSINSNQALFSLLGTIYGGDGRTTFALPDLRSRLAMHEGHGPGLTNRPQGLKSGSEFNILSVAQMPSHSHTVNIQAVEEATTDNPDGSYIAGSGSPAFGTVPDISLATPTVGNTGGNQEVNNLPPYLTVNYIICLQGTYPSRN